MNASDRNLIQQDLPPSRPPSGGQARRGPGLWTFILIALGVLFLLENLGVRTGVVWSAVAVWWPLVLIVIGAELITRPYAWGRQLTLGLALLVALVLGFWSLVRPPILGGLAHQTVSLPITASRAEIQIGTTVGRLEVGVNRTGKLLDGAFNLRRNERLEREVGTRGDAQFVRLEAKQNGPSAVWPGTNITNNATWKLDLTPNVPMVLRLNTGVGDSRIDLADLKVTDLTLNTGIGQTTVVLPATGRVIARVDSGIGQTNVRIPNGLEARIRAASGIGSVRVSGNYQRDGDVYTSPNFASATDRVELEVKGGIGRVNIEPGR